MNVVRFSCEYDLVAPLYSLDAAVLRERDEAQRQPLQRWFVHQDGQAIGAVATWLRPDDRLFLAFKVDNVRAFGPLVDAVVAALHRPLSTTVDLGEADHVAALRDCGFTVETVGEGFRIRLSDVRRLVQRAWVPSGYHIASVADVDERKAFELDIEIRNLVPGTHGWIGDPEWFHEELRSPEFDRDAYLIAVEQVHDRYVGLLRIWRNPDGPRLGLIGVLPERLRTPIAAALLKQGLKAASGWGYDSFMTETSPSNAHTYPRLERLAAERLGRFAQLSRQPSPVSHQPSAAS